LQALGREQHAGLDEFLVDLAHLRHDLCHELSIRPHAARLALLGGLAQDHDSHRRLSCSVPVSRPVSRSLPERRTGGGEIDRPRDFFGRFYKLLSGKDLRRRILPRTTRAGGTTRTPPRAWCSA